MNSTYITAEALGNDVGARRPDRHSLILLCLRGLGAAVDEAWVADVEDRLVLPKGTGRGLGPGPRAHRAPRKSKYSRPAPSCSSDAGDGHGRVDGPPQPVYPPH